jgi:hypothetical protein
MKEKYHLVNRSNAQNDLRNLMVLIGDDVDIELMSMDFLRRNMRYEFNNKINTVNDCND